jgi:hypothetical protein
LAAYTIWTARAAEAAKSPDKILLSAANHVFLLGHLYTLSGLLAVAIRPSHSSSGAHTAIPEMLLTVAALKISTSVVGLLGMFYLKSKVGDDDFNSSGNRSAVVAVEFPFRQTDAEQEQWQTAKQSILNTAGQIVAQLTQLQEAVSRFEQTVSKVGESITQLQTRVGDAGTVFLQLEGNANRSSQKLEAATKQMSTFTNGFSELERVLDDFARVIDERIDLAQQ